MVLKDLSWLCTRDHMGCQQSNPGRPQARQVPCLVCPLSNPKSDLSGKENIECSGGTEVITEMPGVTHRVILELLIVHVNDVGADTIQEVLGMRDEDQDTLKTAKSESQSGRPPRPRELGPRSLPVCCMFLSHSPCHSYWTLFSHRTLFDRPRSTATPRVSSPLF